MWNLTIEMLGFVTIRRDIIVPSDAEPRPSELTVRSFEELAREILLARDAEVGRTGTYQTTFTIPNLNREETRLPIGTVVLASQRVPISEALYSVKTTAAQNVGHPLIHGDEKLLPSVTRVFSTSRDMYVYLEAYEQYADTMRPSCRSAHFSLVCGKVRAGDFHQSRPPGQNTRACFSAFNGFQARCTSTRCLLLTA